MWNKSSMNSNHEFALVVLTDKANWVSDTCLHYYTFHTAWIILCSTVILIKNLSWCVMPLRVLKQWKNHTIHLVGLYDLFSQCTTCSF